MKRIVILGSTGAGKSTLGRHLGALLNIRVSHLDALYWKPGWVMTEPDERAKIMQELVKPETWIIEGNYAETLNLRLPLADTIIYLDFAPLTCVYRVLIRWAQYRGRPRPDMGPNCPEKMDWEFVRWTWNFQQAIRPQILAALEQHGAGKNVIVLKSPAKLSRFLHRAAQKHILGTVDPRLETRLLRTRDLR